MIWVTSDLHFGHMQIVKYEPKRKEVLGETIAEHDETLLKRINSKVKPDDILIILGDFSLSSGQVVRDYRARIHCKNVQLVVGNHDKHSQSFYQNAGFSVVCYEMTLKICTEYVRLRHHPYRKPWWRTIFPWQYKERDRNKRPINRGGFLLHGHVHSRQAQRIIGRRINVGVDMNNYYPLSMKDLEKLISQTKEKEKKAKKENVFCLVQDWVEKLLRH